MTRFYIIFFIGLLLTSTRTFAQSVNGKWVGKLSQGPGDGMSRLYDFELELKVNKRNNISGESYGYITDSVRLRIGISGALKGDSLDIHEQLYMITDSFIVKPWQLCIKNLQLVYRQDGEYEYLQGTWDGVGIDDEKSCDPGNVILSRNMHDVELFLANGGITNTAPLIIPPVPEFTNVFANTTVSKIKEIDVEHRNIQIRLSDYRNIDDDTVSVYLNRSILARKIRVSRSAVKINFNLSNTTNLHEILLYAENLGKIPPNTSMMEIIDGTKSYRIKIESDKQKTAAVYLRYKP